MHPGDEVVTHADRTAVGVIMRLLDTEPEPRYLVFFGPGDQRTLYSSQLLTPDLTHEPLVTADFARAVLTATQLDHPSSEHLYSLDAARIDFIPYQFRPVMQLIAADRPRLLIADEVGIGKTIETGLILKELSSRSAIESVLIICPKPLITEHKWRDEMKRFDEDFEELDGDRLRYCIEETHLDGRWPARYARAIVPYSLLDERLLNGSQDRRFPVRGLLDLEEAPRFDLVIVDEAHHVRNTDTWSHRVVDYFVDSAETVVFLSATPVQAHSQDLLSLLKLLRPDVFTSAADFELIGEPNAAINQAVRVARAGGDAWKPSALSSLQAALRTTWGSNVLRLNTVLPELLELLESEAHDEVARVRAIRLLELMHGFAPYMTRTRRRDIGEFTVRRAVTVPVEFTPIQQRVHDELIQLCSDLIELRHGSLMVRFLVAGLRRQVSSSVNGLRARLHELIGSRVASVDAFGDEVDTRGPLDPELADEFKHRAEALLQLCDELDDEDPKYEALVELLREKSLAENPKALLFTSFRHTVGYLEERLHQDGIRVGQVNGSIDDRERRDIRRRFKLPVSDPDALDVLLSTEVGTEGLDFQFCDMLINYDLPWNPMRIEQRIGRIDRYGQVSPSVAIVNLVTQGTIDAEIYDRCLIRIGVFEQSIGDSEVILGDLAQDIEEVVLDPTLTDGEREQRLQQLADNANRLTFETRELEQAEASLFGLDVPLGTDEVENARNEWVSPAAIAHLVVEYLGGIDPARRLNLRTSGSSVLRVPRDVREALLADLPASREGSQSDRSWQAWLRGSEPSVTVTLDRVVASEDATAHLLSATHPLVRAAVARATRDRRTLDVALRVGGPSNLTGQHPFAVYEWRRRGLRESAELRVFADRPEVADAVRHAFIAGDMESVSGDDDGGDIALVERVQYAAWNTAREDFRNATRDRANQMIASLDTTARATSALLERQLAEASDPRIRRLKSGQIANRRQEADRRRAELEVAKQECDVESFCLVRGMVEFA